MHKVIFQFLKRYYFDNNVILDAINSTYLKIVQKCKTKILFINCFSWILTVAKHELFGLLKHKKNEVCYEKMDIFPTNNDMQKLEFKDIIDRLPDADKSLLYFIYIKEYNYDKICKIFHCSESTIKRRKREVLDVLKGEFANE